MKDSERSVGDEADGLRNDLIVSAYHRSLAQHAVNARAYVDEMSKQLMEIGRRIRANYDAFKPSLDAISAGILQLASVLPALLKTLPPNVLQLGGDVDFERMVELSQSEGLQFAYVPPVGVIKKVMVAPDAAGRRTVIRDNRRTILTACERELSLVSLPDLRTHVKFAESSAAALRAGHRDASQALSANLLDTLLAFRLGPLKKLVTNQHPRPDLQELSVRASLTLSGIWAAHGHFYPGRGEQVPRLYSRHGSVHGVSRRQFTEVNAILALMHVVAFLRLVDSQPDLALDDLA